MVEGLVVKAGSREPLKKAQVTLIALGGGPTAGARTDADGRFLFTGIDPGRYELWADRSGYIRRSYSHQDCDPGIVSDGSPLPRAHALYRATPLVIEPAEHRRDIVVELLPGAVIAGRVLDEDCDPVPDAAVQAVQLTKTPEGLQLTSVQNAMANDIGEYRLAGLTPGSYLVAAYNGGHAYLWKPNQSSILTYHPGVHDSSLAASIEVAAGEEVRGIDVMLRLPARMVSVRGRVVSPGDRRPLPGVSVQLMPSQASSVKAFGQARTNELGAFELRGLTPGDYQMIWQSLGGRQQVCTTGQKPFTVGDTDVDGVELVLIELAGRVRVEGDAPVSFTGWHAGLAPREDWRTRGFGRGVPLAPDGAFIFNGVAPGSYTINVTGHPAGLYLKSARLGDREVLGTGFELGTESPPARLELVLSSDGGRIDGVVLDDQLRPLGGARVSLIPDAAARWQQHLLRISMADEGGHFTVQGIVAGEYLLSACEWPANADRIAKCQRSGHRCRVEVGSSQVITLRVIPEDQSPTRLMP